MILASLFGTGFRGTSGSIWSLFTSWVIPGTHSTPAEWALFALTLLLLFRFWRTISGQSGPGDDE